MTLEEVKLVQTSWAMVAPISDQAAALFYGRLFEIDPQLKLLFKSDINEQGKKLMQMIGMVVHGLANFERLLPAVQDLGRRHTRYGVDDSHYEMVASALLWTLEKGLGNGFTPEVRSAWTSAYTALAKTMKDAGRS
jgi:hemoglobin-like flavoprotein